MRLFCDALLRCLAFLCIVVANAQSLALLRESFHWGIVMFYYCCHALLCFAVLCFTNIVVFYCAVLPLVVVGAVALLWDRPWGSRVQHCVPLLRCFNTVFHCCVVSTLCCTVVLFQHCVVLLCCCNTVLHCSTVEDREGSGANCATAATLIERFSLDKISFLESNCFFFMLKKKYRNWVRNINIIGIKLSDNDNDVSNPPFGPFDCQLNTCHWKWKFCYFFHLLFLCHQLWSKRLFQMRSSYIGCNRTCVSTLEIQCQIGNTNSRTIVRKWNTVAGILFTRYLWKWEQK